MDSRFTNDEPIQMRMTNIRSGWVKLGYFGLLVLALLLLCFVAGFLPVKPSWSNDDAKDDVVSTLVDIPDLKLLQQLSYKELASLYHRYVNRLQVLCHRIVRIGSLGDGGWEICEDGPFRPVQPCLVYSFGINNDFSFDDHMADRYKCEVHSFDPSMTIPSGRRERASNSWFHKMGLSDRKEEFSNGLKMNTLHNILTELHHSNTKIDVLKIDIEKYEWQALEQIFSVGGVKNIKQLVIELHVAIVGEPSRLEYYKALSVLKSLHDSGFRLFYTHRNLWCKYLSAQMADIDEIGCHEVSFVYIPN